MMKFWWSAVFGATLVVSVSAQDVVDAPPIPPPTQSGEPLEPEVTIIQRDDGTVYEYRVGGQVYMTKVVPTKGPAYYFVDQDGDGRLDAQRYGPGEISVPQWILFRW